MDLSRIIVGFTSHFQTRVQILDCLPGHSRRTRLFRGRLAMAFFYDDASCLEAQRRSLLTIPRIIKRLETFHRQLHRGRGGRRGGGGGNDHEIDYGDLAARISILDISLDICLPRLHSNNNNNSGSRRKSNQQQEKEEEEEVLFNNDVDTLAQLLRSMFTNISDSGASHITRTAAKEVLNQVYYRLIYALRTKPRSKPNLFHDDHSVNVVVATNRHRGTRPIPGGRPDAGGGGGGGSADDAGNAGDAGDAGDAGGDGNKVNGPLMRYFSKTNLAMSKERNE